MSKKLALRDVKNSYVAETSSSPASNVDELHQEISVCSLVFALILHLIYTFFFSNNMVLLGVISRKPMRRYRKGKSFWKSSESE